MTTPVIGTFSDVHAIEKARAALRDSSLAIEKSEALSDVAEEVVSQITGIGFSQDQARELSKVVGAGKRLLVVYVADNDADHATVLLTRLEKETGGSETRYEETRRLPEVEEEAAVAKREVEGGVRATAEVTETPVERTVTLRDERVDVHRESADRPLRPVEANEAFREKELEVTGKTETAHIEKEARDTGEVVIEKHTAQREETLHDTVRSTDVQIERTGKTGRTKR